MGKTRNRRKRSVRNLAEKLRPVRGRIRIMVSELTENMESKLIRNDLLASLEVESWSDDLD